MIGVWVRDNEKAMAAEFFELFKTPWAFLDTNGRYDAIVATREVPPGRWPCPQLRFDSESRSETGGAPRLLRFGARRFPVFGALKTFTEADGSPIRMDPEGTAVCCLEGPNRLRIGYDLFEEARRLLTVGQSPEVAAIPTLDIHVGVVRDLILGMGVPIVEIGPAPAGHSMLACLTHDVDFVRIADHGFNHTVRGFVWRALFSSVSRWRRGELTVRQVLTNWGAVLSLPLVWLGWRKDFWDEFERYMDLENPHPSTYFLLPFKNRPGRNVSLPHPERRAACYEAAEIADQVAQLAARGHEIALHGIDAWLDAGDARTERERIAATAGSCAGVRMHWLCFDPGQSPTKLDEAGFEYDSTCGFNETVGFKAGTSQVFAPPGCRRLLEVPMHLQDVALFYPDSLALSPAEAWMRSVEILDAAREHSGLVTVLWHTRSLSPERLWGDLYERLIRELERRGAWFGTAAQVAAWFRRRREAAVTEVSVSDEGGVRARLVDRTGGNDRLVLRVSVPGNKRDGRRTVRRYDVPWSGCRDLRVRLDVTNAARRWEVDAP